ncbi:AAA domain-containing protein [Psidium guajava]|nr:AAA domain-containing protein [Psidium guajava]
MHIILKLSLLLEQLRWISAYVGVFCLHCDLILLNFFMMSKVLLFSAIYIGHHSLCYVFVSNTLLLLYLT